MFGEILKKGCRKATMNNISKSNKSANEGDGNEGMSLTGIHD